MVRGRWIGSAVVLPWAVAVVACGKPGASRGPAAALAVEFVGLGTTYHPGRWSSAGDLITLQPTRGDGSPSEYPLTWRLEGGRLVPVTWDKNTYGASGLPLAKSVQPAAQRPDSNAGAAR